MRPGSVGACCLTAVRAIVFDFDGTLALTRIDFALMRRRTEEHIRAWGLWDESVAAAGYVLEQVQAAARKLEGSAERKAAYLAEATAILEDVEMQTCREAEPFPGVWEGLACLASRGYRLGIITRNCRRAVEAVLQRHPLPHQVLLTRDDVVAVKPDADHLLSALRLLGVPAHEALMVGDHRTDIECGRAAGAFTCGVLTDRTTREEHEEAGADLVVDSVAELARVLCGRDLADP